MPTTREICMEMRDLYEYHGNILFRWRSYLPLLMILLFAASLHTFTYPFGSHALDLAWEGFCLMVTGIGILVRFYTAGTVPGGTSGRTTKRQVARSLNTTGIYSVVRHPLYLGNFFMFLGVVLFYRFWWLTLVSILFFILYYERIMFAEEAFLRKQFPDSFPDWAEKTPVIIPDFRTWRRPELTFSLRTAIKREYSSIFATIATLTVMEIAAEFIVQGHLALDYPWIVLFGIGCVGYLTVFIIHKKTSLLTVDGR